MNDQLGKPLLLLKFSSNIEWLKDLQQGIMYMNNAKYFIDREKMDGVQGIGDKYELSNIMKAGVMQVLNPLTKEIIGEISIKELSFRMDVFTKMPMFCMSLLSESMFTETLVEGNCIKYYLNITDSDIERIKLEFGEHVLIINFTKFIKQMETVFNEKGLKVFRSRVKYHDFNTLKDRFEAHKNQDPELFFFKHDTFSHQMEYRIVVWNIETDDPYIVHIGDVSEFSSIYKVEELKTLHIEEMN